MNVIIFKGDVKNYPVWLTHIDEKEVKYEVDVDGQIVERFFRFNRIRVNWGAEKASVHFCEKEIIFELPGVCTG